MRKGITLSVGGRVELNLILEIGVLSESVTVTADVSLLETANATLGRVVSTEEVRSLPINHGNVDNLIRLGTGVGFTDDPAKDQPWEPLNTAYAMAGSVSSRNEFTLDGASNTLHDARRPHHAGFAALVKGQSSRVQSTRSFEGSHFPGAAQNWIR